MFHTKLEYCDHLGKIHPEQGYMQAHPPIEEGREKM